MRALILVRQSITQVDSLSLESQEERTRAHCAREGYQIVGVLSEASVRGWWDEREMIAEIYALAERREFDVLVTWDISRVARTVRQIENLIYDLAKRGAGFDSVSEPYVKHPVMRQVMGAMAEEQTRIIARNVAGAIRRQVARGSHNGQRPFGYRVNLIKDVDGKNIRHLEPVPSEAAVILLIYERYADGWSIGELHRWLNEDPTIPPRPRGGRWSQSALWFVLRLEVYTGVVSVRADTPAGRAFADVRTEGAHEAIIPRDLWDRVQRRLNADAPHSRVEKRDHSWMEGIVLCSGCSRPMYYVVRARPGSDYPDRSWACSTTIMHANGTRAIACPAAKHRVGAGWVEERAVAAVGRDLARAGKATDAHLRRHLTPTDVRVDELSARMAKLVHSRDNLIAAIKSGSGLGEVLGPDLSSTVRQIATLELEYGRLRQTTTLASLQRARAHVRDLALAWERTPDDERRAVAMRLGMRLMVDAATRSVRAGYDAEFAWIGRD